jgi:GNAT superfamily N-acetyltransferase
LEFIRKTDLSNAEKVQILEFWNNEYPEKLVYPTLKSFEGYLEHLANPFHVLMMDENQRIKGWHFDFEREQERWFAIILDSAMQGKGFGTKLLKLAKEKETELNGWVIDGEFERKRNGDLYRSPLSFYLKNGFEKKSGTRLELEKISAVKITWRK